MCTSTCGLVAMTSASHAEGCQFDPGQVYWTCQSLLSLRSLPQKQLYKALTKLTGKAHNWLDKLIGSRSL